MSSSTLLSLQTPSSSTTFYSPAFRRITKISTYTHKSLIATLIIVIMLSHTITTCASSVYRRHQPYLFKRTSSSVVMSKTVVVAQKQLSFCYHASRQQQCQQQRRKFHGSSALYLNRFLFDPCEVEGSMMIEELKDNSDNKLTRTPFVILPKDDYRTIHAAKILNVHNGDTIRAGIVGEDKGGNDNETITAYHNTGLVTDDAVIEWLPEGKIKKAQPTKNRDPPGSLKVMLHSLSAPEGETSSSSSSSFTQPVSLILALPRPLQLGRMLPMIAQLGVDHLILTSAQKVPKDYFGSHLFRKPNELRKHLIEGLCQAGDVKIPRVTVVKRLKIFLEDELEDMFPIEDVARVIAHPQRKNEDGVPMRIRDVKFPSSEDNDDDVDVANKPKRIVLAVGPEGGWAEDYELDMFQERGFQQITLGTRVLRSDVAVVSLLSLAHDVCVADQ